MSINTQKQMIAAALRQTHNVPGTCQLTVRGWFNAPSAGDVDHDGDADAIDGWLSEPSKARHPGDRNPPPGVPLAFKNRNRNGYGHRAATLVNGIRSTDMLDNHYAPGHTSTVVGKTRSEQIAVLENSMGLEYLGWTETIDGHPIPGFNAFVRNPKPKSADVRIIHASGQFSDTDGQHGADAIKIFNRAQAKNVGWVTTTEGGPGAGGSNWTRHFLEQAQKHNFKAFATPGTDVMIAVNKDLIDGGWKTHLGPIVVPGKARDHAAKRVVAVQFRNNELGVINVVPGHYLTKGRPSAKSPEFRKHLEENRIFAKAIGDYLKEVSQGSALGFYAGDQNISDKIDDTFLGQAKLISMWDELKHYENTGHGNIDVIARFKGDRRVKAKSIHAYNDKKFFLNSDHFMIEGVYNIRTLKA
jgi:hypothetical protein